MVSNSQIREQIAQFLDLRIDLNALNYWLALNTAESNFGGSAAAENLTFALQELISEYSNRYISPSKLRQELKQLVSRDNTVFVYSDANSPAEPMVSQSWTVPMVSAFAQL
jgi:hypothetical protein